MHGCIIGWIDIFIKSQYITVFIIMRDSNNVTAQAIVSKSALKYTQGKSIISKIFNAWSYSQC